MKQWILLLAIAVAIHVGADTVEDVLPLSKGKDDEGTKFNPNVTKSVGLVDKLTMTRESEPSGSQNEMAETSSEGSVRTKRALPATFLAAAAGEIGGKVVSKLGDRIAEGVIENHQEKVVSGVQNYLGKQIDKFDDEYKDLLKETSGLAAGLGRQIEEADIQLVPKPGATMGNMYAPPGWEIRHKYKYKDDSENRGSSSGQTAAYTYPAGLGPVLMNGCFGTGYKNGDPCFQAKIPRTGCPNLIDGATYLGVGFDGRGVYSAESRKKSIIQRSCNNLQTYGENEVPDSMTVQGIYDTKVESYTFSSTEEYRQYLAEKSAVTSAKAMFQEEINKASGHGAGGGPFGFLFSVGGGKSSQSGTSSQSAGSASSSSARAQLSEQQTQTFMAMLEMDIFRYEIFMDDVTPDQLNVGFLRDFISLPKSYFSPGAEIIFQNFYLRWGTHYIKSAKFGGQLKIIKTKEATKDLSMSEFATRAEADWKMTMSTFSAQAAQTKSSSWWHEHETKSESKQAAGQTASGSASQTSNRQEEKISSQEYSNEMLVVQGGDQQIAAAITEMYTTALTTELKDWLESIKDYPKPFSFVLRRVTDVLNVPFDSLFPAGEVDYGCLGKTHLKTEKETGRRYYVQTTTKNNEGSQHELILNTTNTNNSATVTVSEIRYCNFADRKDLEESMSKKRMSLERAVTVYLEEGRLLSSDFLLPAGEAGCETAMLAFLQGDNTGVPTWEDMTGGKEFTVIFDMPYDIPGILQAQDVLELKFFRHLWFSTRRGAMPHLYDGYDNGGSNDVQFKKLSVQGLVMTYDEETGVFTVTDDDYNASKSFLHDLPTWIKGRIVARAEYKKLLNHLSQKSDTVGDVPCNIHWSNAHRFDPTEGGKCIHFTAASEGDIFVVFASIPQNHETWVYIQISPEGVALYKAMRLQTTQLNGNAGGLGSATLYQSYFVCVTEDVDETTTVVQYGKTPDNEEQPHVWLSFTFHELVSLRYYSFGSGDSPVKVMGLSLLDSPAKDFIICRQGTEMINGVCQQKCHPECEGCRTSGSNSPTDCIACKHLKLPYPYKEGGIGAFECVTRCPQHMESKNGTQICSCIKRMETEHPDGVVDCVTDCPLTHYDENNLCKECSSFCKDVSDEGRRVCSGPSSEECDTCKYQHEGSCVEGCIPGQRAFGAALLLDGLSEHQTYHMGLYLLQTNESQQPLYKDNRPVYKHEARDWFIYFISETPRWWIGPDIQEAKGGLQVADSHVVPEDITGSWKVWQEKEKRWVEDRNVTLQPAKDTPITCRLCQIGHECKLGDEREYICPVGTASNDKRTMCIPCAAGEFSSTPGAASCQKCPAGKYSTGEGSVGCLDCPVGKYSDTAGSRGCKVCPAGKYSSTAGSNGCMPCPAGRYNNKSEANGCNLCPAGKYTKEVGSTACMACPSGQFSSTAGSTGCTACPAGEYSSTAGSTSCRACPAGKFSSTGGATHCTACAAGEYSSTTGSASCTACPAGKYVGTEGSTGCALCRKGKFSGTAGSSICTNCPAGKYSSREGSTACVDCPAGKYSDETGSEECKDCPPVLFTSVAGSVGCTACRIGATTDANGGFACQGPQRTSLACEGQTMTLDCDLGQEIQVQYALYGRKDHGICPRGIHLTDNCYSSTSLSNVRSSCQGHRTCSVQASNDVFGEPCFGTSKYLQVQFTCIGRWAA